MNEVYDEAVANDAEDNVDKEFYQSEADRDGASDTDNRETNDVVNPLVYNNPHGD